MHTPIIEHIGNLNARVVHGNFEQSALSARVFLFSSQSFVRMALRPLGTVNVFWARRLRLFGEVTRRLSKGNTDKEPNSGEVRQNRVKLELGGRDEEMYPLRFFWLKSGTPWFLGTHGGKYIYTLSLCIFFCTRFGPKTTGSIFHLFEALAQ